MRVAFKLQQDNTRVTRQSMDGVLLMPALQQFSRATADAPGRSSRMGASSDPPSTT